ncbi:asparagine synthase (glutamine-hydrolyzing) [Kibdelosporangium philippinense]|uniref:asparagine synthase (glutamine-hydrolyzing) n=1 Tax=Kibdelosporangium philippinense TaxID=211113 RepID=A0ABS8ZJ05_9PSEU|nr:asparagine synthase (glutamine-hydrolyzing) [Kibdelosporangium philippinense]MCE7007793.1 asparagine synthase (glutamine-hydrolyzing) [Kibdelosporangium philippinense]
MCGITGWVSYRRNLTHEQAIVDAMTQTMSCRGPDAAGTWSEPNVALGHRRLAVIDLPGGAQPMRVSTPDGDVVMVYSGEAYNFTELRNELNDQEFFSDSDTEVVLRGYLRWGPAVADRLNGMYAFAIWDGRTQELVMIRDRMGIKPFYFYPTPDGVLFGSEPKAIFANPLAKRVIDVDGFRELFGFIKTPGHATWQGMREVEPGTIVTVSKDGIKTRTYWRLEAKPHRDSVEDTVLHVRELLDDIVRRQLVADVPRCVLLSGGLDSSAITTIAANQLDEPVRSFSVDFVGQTENFQPDELRATPDTPYVHDVADYVHTDHTDIVLNHSELSDPELRRKVITARDIPVGLGDMDASLYLLFKAIRGKSTVALSGESADEIFGGYRQFHDPVIQQTDFFPWLMLARTMHHESSLTPELEKALDLRTFLTDSYSSAVAEVDRVDGEDEFTHRMRVMSYLHLTRFVRILLDRKDRMSMAVGLEVRVPFCDHRLVEYVYNAPWSMKTYDGREKSLLRGAAKDVLPQSVVERVKSPYPSTQDPLYLADIERQANALPADHPVFSLIDRKALPGGHRYTLERTLSLATWLDIYQPEVVF